MLSKPFLLCCSPACYKFRDFLGGFCVLRSDRPLHASQFAQPAPVGHTDVSLYSDVRRGGRIDRSNQGDVCSVLRPDTPTLKPKPSCGLLLVPLQPWNSGNNVGMRVPWGTRGKLSERKMKTTSWSSGSTPGSDNLEAGGVALKQKRRDKWRAPSPALLGRVLRCTTYTNSAIARAPAGSRYCGRPLWSGYCCCGSIPRT